MTTLLSKLTDASDRYNGNLTKIGNITTVELKLHEEEETALTLSDDGELTLTCTATAELENRPKRAVMRMSSDRTAMYDTMTSILVLTLGTACYFDSMSTVVEIDSRLNSSRRYPIVARYTPGDYMNIMDELKQLRLRNPTIDTMMSPMITGIHIPHHTDGICIRCNWEQAAVSIEYNDYIVGSLVKDTLTISSVLILAESLLGELNNIILRHGDIKIPPSEAKRLSTLLNKMIKEATAVPVFSPTDKYS